MNKLRTYEYQHSSRLARFVERWRGLANSFLLLLLYDRKKTRENNRKIWHAQLQVGSHQCSPDGTTSRNRRRPGRRRPCRSWRPPWRRPWAVGWTIRVKWPRPARRRVARPPREARGCRWRRATPGLRSDSTSGAHILNHSISTWTGQYSLIPWLGYDVRVEVAVSKSFFNFGR